MAIERDLELLFEVGTMRHLARSWRQFGGVNFSNVAEHSYRVIWIALILAKHEGGDMAKVIKMALLHDLPETRTGDVHYLSRLYTARNEKLAIADVFAGTALEDEGASLLQELEKLESIEAKIVKDADTLDCDLELQEQAAIGVNLKSSFQQMRQATGQKLRTETAKLLFRKILESDPNDWHVKGRNRFTEGDWRVSAPTSAPLGPPEDSQ